ncbi:MAG: response regulator transcription factor [Wenzhouxiangellaceae bacterium]
MQADHHSLAPGKLLVADDHPLFRSALVASISRYLPDWQFVEAHSFSDLQQALSGHADADLVLMDLHMPGATGLSGLAFVCGHYPALPVVMISANDDPAVIRRALDDGAAGFIPKSADAETIIHAIRQVLAGDTWVPEQAADTSRGDSVEVDLARRVGELTPQQYNVLQMLAQGLLNKQIAYELKVTEATVKAHVTAIMRKLGVSNRTQAVTLFNQLAVQRPELKL